ncbi:MAG: hypothetical protein COB12_06115 [Flavobacterium sp.]|nr:MAG: hypothetical protein COB12_06115 [Flavobacterium sp.]
MDSSNDKDNIEAYSKLLEELKFEFSLIFQKCNMTGEAHNQLHNFLVPVKNIFKSLSSSELVKCQDSYDKLNTHLKEYKKYFKTII